MTIEVLQHTSHRIASINEIICIFCKLCICICSIRHTSLNLIDILLQLILKMNLVYFCFFYSTLYFSFILFISFTMNANLQVKLNWVLKYEENKLLFISKTASSCHEKGAMNYFYYSLFVLINFSYFFRFFLLCWLHKPYLRFWKCRATYGKQLVFNYFL